MNRIFKVSKYQLYETIKSLLVYYSIIFLIALSVIWMSNMFSSSKSNIHFSGFSLSAAVFLFVTGLNMFKNNFNFMQSFNVSRKNFYFGSIITIVILSVMVTLIDSMSNSILNSVGIYKGVFEQIYGYRDSVKELIWLFSLFIYAFSLGLFITLIYYRSSTIMRYVVSLAPFVIIILISVIESIFSLSLWVKIGDLFVDMLGIGVSNGSYIAALTLLSSFILNMIFSRLLMNKAYVKA